MVLVAATPAERVQRVLARFELGCPSLRDYQVAVQVETRTPQLYMLPAASAPRGLIELVFTAHGGLRTCLYPHGLGNAQQAAVEDLAWALREALVGQAPEAQVASPPPRATIEKR
ncbi:MAG: hypothetical protein LC624_05750 [Halobacteriales archaeon]|nr:hypothetical protein [Halobacteriales archaeon]